MMGMFIRSQDGKHLVEATSVDLDGAKILVNGEPFAAYEDEEVAQDVFRELCEECADFETFFDLKGEIDPDDDDDEDWDGDDDDDDDFGDEGGDRGFRFLYPGTVNRDGSSFI